MKWGEEIKKKIVIIYNTVYSLCCTCIYFIIFLITDPLNFSHVRTSIYFSLRHFCLFMYLLVYVYTAGRSWGANSITSWPCFLCPWSNVQSQRPGFADWLCLQVSKTNLASAVSWALRNQPAGDSENHQHTLHFPWGLICNSFIIIFFSFYFQ